MNRSRAITVEKLVVWGLLMVLLHPVLLLGRLIAWTAVTILILRLRWAACPDAAVGARTRGLWCNAVVIALFRIRGNCCSGLRRWLICCLCLV